MGCSDNNLRLCYRRKKKEEAGMRRENHSSSSHLSLFFPLVSFFLFVVPTSVMTDSFRFKVYAQEIEGLAQKICNTLGRYGAPFGVTDNPDEANIVVTYQQKIAKEQHSMGSIVILLQTTLVFTNQVPKELPPSAVLEQGTLGFQLGSSDEDKIVTAVGDAIQQTYSARCISDGLPKLSATAALNGWDSIHGLKQQLGLADVLHPLTTNGGKARITGLPNGTKSSWHDSQSPLLLVISKGSAILQPTEKDMQGISAIIIAAPHSRYDIPIQTQVRQLQDREIWMPRALTFYQATNSGSLDPTEAQIAEIIRDGIDQINHRGHLNNVTPPTDTTPLYAALDQLQLNSVQLMKILHLPVPV
jgi:hypothetical protein